MYLVEVIYGSRLFGTAVATSDIDKKRIYLSDMQDLVMGRTDARNTVTGKGANKVEVEEHHITAFARMVMQGQTLALSLLFAPDNMVTHRTPQWDELLRGRSRLVSRNLLPFVGYARSQSIKYSLKGERLRTLGDFVETITKMEPAGLEGRLHPLQFESLQTAFGQREGVRLWTEKTAGGPIRHIEVGGRSFGETTPLKLWVAPLTTMLNRYGKRAMSAKEENGRDLKAMYHAIRLTGEMNELLRTGHITYPRPEAALLLAVRRGEFTNEEVSEMIDRGMEEGDRLFQSSTLPDKPDEEWLYSWVIRTQADYACRSWLDEKQ